MTANLKRILTLIVLGANFLLVSSVQASVVFELVSNGSPYKLSLASYGLNSSLIFLFENQSVSVSTQDDPYNNFHFHVDISEAFNADFIDISFGGQDVSVSDLRDTDQSGTGSSLFGDPQLTQLPFYYDNTFWILARPGSLVTVTNPGGSSIPEPATLAMVMVGLAMLGAIQRYTHRLR